MDSTLQQLLTALFQAHQLIDQLRARVQELEQAAQQRDRTDDSQELRDLMASAS